MSIPAHPTDGAVLLAIDTCGTTGGVALGRVSTVSGAPVQILATAELQTGVRVCVSAVKGLAEGLSIPVIAISRLELLARQADGNACAALDSGRGEFYAGLYRNGQRVLEALYTHDEIVLAVRDSALPLVFCEAGAAAGFEGAVLVQSPTASDAIALGAERFVAGDFADAASLDGNYLRRPYAEIPTSITPSIA
jgi:tRNA threonylcarbamoyladenosine biosynthesis protein TsaB